MGPAHGQRPDPEKLFTPVGVVVLLGDVIPIAKVLCLAIVLGLLGEALRFGVRLRSVGHGTFSTRPAT